MNSKELIDLAYAAEEDGFEITIDRRHDFPEIVIGISIGEFTYENKSLDEELEDARVDHRVFLDDELDAMAYYYG